MLSRICFAVLLWVAALTAFPSWAATRYEIEAAVNDEKFVINGEIYEAKTYCLGWDQGEWVIFIEGSALGVCMSATLYNLNRKETCEVWCP